MRQLRDADCSLQMATFKERSYNMECTGLETGNAHTQENNPMEQTKRLKASKTNIPHFELACYHGKQPTGGSDE